MQTALPIILAFTYPLPAQSLASSSSPIKAVLFESQYRVSTLLPLAIMFVGGLVNLVVVGPATTEVMKQRKHQETRDGKKYYDPGPKSEEMQKLNKSFGILHGVSSLVNLVAVITCIAYGWSLGNRIA